MTEITDDNFLDIMLGDDSSDTSDHHDHIDEQDGTYLYRNTNNIDENNGIPDDDDEQPNDGTRLLSNVPSSSSSTFSTTMTDAIHNNGNLSSNYTKGIIKDDSVKQTVDMIERDILEAEAALARKHRKRDGSSHDEDNDDNGGILNNNIGRKQRTTVTATVLSSTQQQTIPSMVSSSSSSSTSSSSSASFNNTANNNTNISRSSAISDERRKQILAELAMQRAKTRGYHTDRELRLTLQHQQEQEQKQKRILEQQQQQQQHQQNSKNKHSSSNNTIEAALHTATTAAISNAVEKALANIGFSSTVSTTTTDNSTKTNTFASTKDILGTNESSSLPVKSSVSSSSTSNNNTNNSRTTIGSTTGGGGGENLSKDQRDTLIMQMVTERRARVIAEAEGNPLLLNASLGTNGILSNTNNLFRSQTSSSSSFPPPNDNRSFSRSLAPTVTTATSSTISNALNASLTNNTPFMPPLPPTIAALQAQATAAAASASALAAIAAATSSAHSIGVGTAVKLPRSVNFKEPKESPTESNTILLSSSATKPIKIENSSSADQEFITMNKNVKITTATVPSITTLHTKTANETVTNESTSYSSIPVSTTDIPPSNQLHPHHYADETAASTIKRLSPRNESLSPRPHSYRAPSSPLSPSRKQQQSTNNTSTGPDSDSKNGKYFRRPTLDELRKERETTLYGECTFRPTVHNLKGSSKTSLSNVNNDNQEDDKVHSRGISMERVEQLVTEKQAILEKRERLRKEKEEIEMQDCTFQPRITRSPNRYNNEEDNDSDYDSYSDEESSINDDIGMNMYRENVPTVQRASVTKIPAPIVMKKTNGTTVLSPNPPVTHKTNTHLPSPPQIGSPLQWETSLSRKYLEKKPMVPSNPVRTSPRAGTVPNPPSVPKVTVPIPQPPPVATVPNKGMVRPTVPSIDGTETTSVTSPTIPGNSKPPPVVARLYADAETRKLEKAKVKATIERAQMSSYTFKPAINPISVAIVTKEQETNQTSTKPLHERSTDIQRARAENIHRLRMENILSNPEYTFKPRINEVSERIAIEKAKMNGIPISDDNTNDGGIRAIKSTTTGTNDIDPAGAVNDGKPNDTTNKKSLPASVASTLRLSREATETQARLEAKRRAAAVAESSQYTFQPRVNPSSERMIEAKLRSMGVLEQKEDTEETGTDTKKKSHPVSKKHNKFFDRQKVMLELQNKHRESLLKELKEQDECVFKPKIGNADEILAHTRPELVTETEEARVQRLAVIEAKHKAQTQAQVAEEYYNQFTYTPEINELSRQRGRAHTVEEHYKNEKGQRIMLRAKAIAEAEFRAKHPFQPTLVANAPVPTVRGNSNEPNELKPPSLTSAGVGVPSTIHRGNQPLRLNIRTDPEHVSQRIAEHLKAKSERIEVAKRLEDVELLKECTFQPETTSSSRSHAKVKEAIATDGGVVVVRGLGRYLELKELQRKLDEEKIEREKEAFSIKGVPAWNENGIPKPPTQPQPFHLSTAETATAMASVKERKQQQGTTNTNEGFDGSNRHLHPSTARAFLQTALDSEGTSFILPSTGSSSTSFKSSPKRTVSGTTARIKSPNNDGMGIRNRSFPTNPNQTLDTTVPMNITHYPHA